MTTFAKFLVLTSAFIVIPINFLSSQSLGNTNDSIAEHTFFSNQSDYRLKLFFAPPKVEMTTTGTTGNDEPPIDQNALTDRLVAAVNIHQKLVAGRADGLDDKTDVLQLAKARKFSLVLFSTFHFSDQSITTKTASGIENSNINPPQKPSRWNTMRGRILDRALSKINSTDAPESPESENREPENKSILSCRVALQLKNSNDGNVLLEFSESVAQSTDEDEAVQQAISEITEKFIRDFSNLNNIIMDSNNFDSNTPRLVVQTSHIGDISQFNFSGDGKLLATLGTNGVAKLWNAETGKELATYASAPVAGVAISPDGKIFAALGQDWIVRLYDITSGEMLYRISSLRKKPFYREPSLLPFIQTKAIAFNDDGRQLLYRDEEGILIWDIATVRLIKKIEITKNQSSLDEMKEDLSRLTGDLSNSMAVHPNGKIVAVIENRNTIRFYDINTADFKKEFKPSVESITALSFSADGRYLVIGSGHGSIRIFNTENEVKPVSSPIIDKCDKVHGNISGIKEKGIGIINIFNQGGKAGNIVEESGTIVDAACSIIVKKDISDFLFMKTSAIKWVEVNNDFSLLAYIGGDGIINVRNLSLNNEEAPLLYSVSKSGEINTNSTDASINSDDSALFFNQQAPVHFSSDGQALIAARGKNIAIWEASTGKEQKTLAVSNRDLGFGSLIPALAGSTSDFINNDQQLMTDTITGGARVWDLAHGAPPEFLAHGGRANPGIRSTISRDGQRVAVIEKERVVVYKYPLYDKILGELKIPDSEKNGDDLVGFMSIRLNMNGTFAATTTFEKTGFNFRIWDVSTGESIFNKTNVLRWAFDPQGDLIAYIEGENVHILQTSDLKNDLIKFNLETNSSIADDFFSPNPVFSNDGKMIAIGENGNNSNNIKLWDLDLTKKGAKLLDSKNVHGFISGITFTPDNSQVSFGCENTLSHWNIKDNIVSQSSIWLAEGWGNLSYNSERQNNYLAAGGNENRVRLIDMRKDQEIGGLIGTNKADWIFVTPEGNVDANRLEDIDEVYWITHDEPYAAHPIELFMREYFEPQLLTRVVKSKQSDINSVVNSPEIIHKNRSTPSIKFKSITPVSPTKVKVVLTAEATISKTQRGDDGHFLSSGVQDVRLFRNQNLVGYVQQDFRDILIKNDMPIELVFEVDLPNVKAGDDINFSAYAFNTDNVKSPTVMTRYKAQEDSEITPKRAFIVNIAVIGKDMPGLPEAADDFNTVSSVKQFLQKSGTFSEVIEIKLNADADSMQIKNHKNQIKKSLMSLAKGVPEEADLTKNKKVSELSVKENVSKTITANPGNYTSGPNDLIMIFYSGHGITNNGIFYLPTADSTEQEIGAGNFSNAINSDELYKWLKDIDAGEIIMVVDACHSAAIFENNDFKPGPFGSKGLGQLAYDKGMLLLASTQASNTSQGGLVDILIKDGLNQSNADHYPRDGMIKMDEWLRYGLYGLPNHAMESGHELQYPQLFNFSVGNERFVIPIE